MKRTIAPGLSFFVLLALPLAMQSARGQDGDLDGPVPQPAAFNLGNTATVTDDACDCAHCTSQAAVSHNAHGCSLAGRCRVKGWSKQGATHAAPSGHCASGHCGGQLGYGHGAYGHAGRGYGGGIVHRLTSQLASIQHSGQPCIDPWMRADWIAANEAAVRSWHAGYYHTQWGVPLALAVPPTARMHTRMGWGVNQSTMAPIYHQFERPYPSAMGMDPGTTATNPLLPTPRWPSHTDQFGVYYVRGPW